MSLTKGKVNPLNVLGIRKLPFIPDHFVTMILPDNKNLTKIDNWIYTNLNSRYCITIKQILDDYKKIINRYELGIEDHKELTFFNLSCPYLKEN